MMSDCQQADGFERVELLVYLFGLWCAGVELGGSSDGEVKAMRVRADGPRELGGVMCGPEGCGMVANGCGEGRMLGLDRRTRRPGG